MMEVKYTNVYENQLTTIDSKLRKVSGDEKMSDAEKLKETSELEQEKKQLQRKIDTEEDTEKKERMKELMGIDEAMKRMSTVSEARAKLQGSIDLAKSQYETDRSRGDNDEKKKESIEKLEKKYNNFTENIMDQISERKDRYIKKIFSDEDKDKGNEIYKGTNYKKKLDVQV